MRELDFDTLRVGMTVERLATPSLQGFPIGTRGKIIKIDSHYLEILWEPARVFDKHNYRDSELYRDGGPTFKVIPDDVDEWAEDFVINPV